MELALYHPEHGYYMGATVRSAREGDFLTAAELHPIFGRVLARQLVEMWDALGRPDPFVLRDEGAGTGALGLSVLAGLRADGAPLLDALAYEPVERNPAHHAALAARITDAGFTDRLRPPTGRRVRADSSARDTVGCVVANELVDALPVHRVVGSVGGRLRESFVAWRDGWFAEEIDDPSTQALEHQLERVGVELAPAQVAEVNLAMAAWLDSVSDRLERGYVLVIDYGHLAAELYAAARAGGTLRAYRGHTAHADPFRFVGRQDLTAHVDFTALGLLASDRGLAPLGTTTQARFLVDGGLERLLVVERERPELDLESYLLLRASIGRLLDPRALGAFRVLLLGRGVPRDRLPSGFGGVATA
jgi:SAM-dependent MidA family methyltransferase